MTDVPDALEERVLDYKKERFNFLIKVLRTMKKNELYFDMNLSLKEQAYYSSLGVMIYGADLSYNLVKKRNRSNEPKVQ